MEVVDHKKRGRETYTALCRETGEIKEFSSRGTFEQFKANLASAFSRYPSEIAWISASQKLWDSEEAVEPLEVSFVTKDNILDFLSSCSAGELEFKTADEGIAKVLTEQFGEPLEVDSSGQRGGFKSFVAKAVR